MISFIIGMLCGLWLMYLLQINRDNELKNRINKAIEYLRDREEDNKCCSVCSVMSDKLLSILGGDVDDE